MIEEKLIAEALGLIKQAELSHAASILTAAELAPGNQTSLDELRDQNLRAAHLSEPRPTDL